MSISVGVYEAKTQFTKLLQAVEAGETVTITRHGKPVAELAAIRPHGLGRRDPGEVFAKIRELRKQVTPISQDDVRASVEEGRR